MRIGLDLRDITDPAEQLARAREADRHGLWAVLVGGARGTEVVAATALAMGTEHIHLAVAVAAAGEHPLTIAEELAVLDHLSVRRALAFVEGPTTFVDQMRRLLHGHIVGGVALAPAPAQTELPVRSIGALAGVALTGDLTADRKTIDAYRDAGVVQLFVTWPGSIPMLARHLASRASGPDFPQVVADVADQIAPFS